MAMFTFNLPDIGEDIAEAEIVAWHVKPGDMVEEDGQLADMMTDKATVEMESPVSCKVLEVAGEVGDVVAIGGMLVVIEVEGEVPEDVLEENEAAAEAAPVAKPAPESKAEPAPEPEPAPTPSAAEKVLASPAVRKRAKDLGIDLSQVKPHEDGRIRHADLDAFISYTGGFSGAAPARADEEIKVIGLRKRIAENMQAAKRNIPHFTYVEECDVTELERTRAQLNANRGDRPKLTLLPLLITAICKALPQFAMINARFDDEARVVTRHGSVHLGMATMTDNGLMVPVTRDAQGKNLFQLASDITRLANAARDGSAKSQELSGSTLTITSLGPLGGVATTPVINRPEVAIIGPNRIVERPMFVTGADGQERIEKRKLMNISISCDHRVVDGYDAAAFVQEVKNLIEAPATILAG